MALGKTNKRIRSHFGDNCHLMFGDPLAWAQIGKTNRWALSYKLGLIKAEMADKSQVHLEDITEVMLEIDLAQSHIDEIALIDILKASETVRFWGDMLKTDGDDQEIYIPELIIGGDIKIETPSSTNIKIPLNFGVQPQSDLFEFQGVDLPTATKHGETPIESTNNYFCVYAAIPD